VYVDLSLTNQQVQIPATAKLVRTDTSTVNFDAQEYITKQYADARIGTSFNRNDASLAILKDNGTFVISPNNDQTITSTIGFNTYSGKLGTMVTNYFGTQRIAGSSYPFNTGLELHPDQSDFSKNRLVIKDLISEAFGTIRYNSAVGITNDLDLVTRGWSNTALSLKANANASLSSFSVPTADVPIGGFKLTGLQDPSANQDAATKAYVLAQVSAGGNQLTYGTQVLLGNVPFTTGSTNTVYALTFNSTNFPTNPSSIITGLDWVRQNRTPADTIRIRVKLDPAIVNGR
jgi:hypothetical protein